MSFKDPPNINYQHEACTTLIIQFVLPCYDSVINYSPYPQVVLLAWPLRAFTPSPRWKRLNLSFSGM